MARLLQLSDLHVAAGQFVSSVLDTRTLLRSGIDTLLDRLDALGPLDAVLVTGDVSDDGSPESYAFARTELDRLGLPLLVVPGNHDRRDALRMAFKNLPEMPASGLLDWVTDIGDVRIVGLDTLIEGQGGGRLRDESLTFLSKVVAGAGEIHMVVALHHPPLMTGIRFMDAIRLENPEDLATALAPLATPARIVSGHVHGVYHGQLGRHPVLTAPSLCSAFMLDLREDAPIGFMTGSTGYAVMDTGAGGVWAAQPLDQVDGPYGF